VLGLLELPLFEGLFEGLCRVGSSLLNTWSEHKNRQAKLAGQQRAQIHDRDLVGGQQKFIRDLERERRLAEGELRLATPAALPPGQGPRAIAQ